MADLFALLPLEILVFIGAVDIESWTALLAVPDFARWTTSDHARRIRRRFLTIKIHTWETEYRLKGLLHNFDDEPARINFYHKEIEWFHLGLLHRENGKPARIINDESFAWYEHGRLTREGSADETNPEIIYANGTQQYSDNSCYPGHPSLYDKWHDLAPEVLINDGIRDNIYDNLNIDNGFIS